MALALGSGGARGYAHIGVIAELADRGYEIVTVSGSSMGALVGGLHCAGKLDEFVDWASTLTQLDLVRLMDVSLSKSGVIGAERVVARVRGSWARSPSRSWRRRSPRWPPISPPGGRSGTSAAVSSTRSARRSRSRRDQPHLSGGRILGDGGILDPLPVAPTVAVPSDVTVGVILGNDFTPEEGPRAVPSSAVWCAAMWPPARQRVRQGPSATGSVWRSWTISISRTAARWCPPTPSPIRRLLPDGQGGGPHPLARHHAGGAGRYQSASHPPDVLIRIPRKSRPYLGVSQGGRADRDRSRADGDRAGSVAGTGLSATHSAWHLGAVVGECRHSPRLRADRARAAQFRRSFDVGITAASAVVSAFAVMRLIFAPGAGRLISIVGNAAST